MCAARMKCRLDDVSRRTRSWSSLVLFSASDAIPQTVQNSFNRLAFSQNSVQSQAIGNPPHNSAEMAEYDRVVEIAYMNEKKQQAIAEVREHPARFAWVTLRRVISRDWLLGAEVKGVDSQ